VAQTFQSDVRGLTFIRRPRVGTNTVSSTDANSAESPRSFGPIRILETSLVRQLLGLALALLGVQIFGWVIDTRPSLWYGVAHAAVGTFVVCNGLYLGGVRLR